MLRVERGRNAPGKPVEAPRRPVRRLGVSKSAWDIRDLLKALRAEKGMTATEVSEIVGVSRTAIYHFENGTRMPKMDTLSKYAEALGCRVVLVLDEFIGDEN